MAFEKFTARVEGRGSRAWGYEQLWHLGFGAFNGFMVLRVCKGLTEDHYCKYAVETGTPYLEKRNVGVVPLFSRAAPLSCPKP